MAIGHVNSRNVQSQELATKHNHQYHIIIGHRIAPPINIDSVELDSKEDDQSCNANSAREIRGQYIRILLLQSRSYLQLRCLALYFLHSIEHIQFQDLEDGSHIGSSIQASVCDFGHD